jgi:hypothetical protein
MYQQSSKPVRRFYWSRRAATALEKLKKIKENS